MVPLEGPVGIGALFDAIMLGCLIVQSCVYYKNSGDDTWLLKILVFLILFLLLSHLGCTAAWLWASTVVNTEATSMPNYGTILFGVSSVCGAIISFLERCFFSYRVLKLSNNHMLAFLFFVFCIFSFTATAGAATMFFANVPASLISQLNNSWIFPLVLICGLVYDLAVNIVTAFYLRSQTPTDVADTLRRVARLPILIAETGAVASFFDVAAILVYWFTRQNFAWVGLIVFMPGVFANALLAALNARGELCADIQHQRVDEIGENLVDKHAKRPSFLITISKRVDRQSEQSPV